MGLLSGDDVAFRAAPGMQWLAPARVRGEEDAVVWELAEPDIFPSPEWVSVTWPGPGSTRREVLDRFLRLADGADSDIVRFVSKWGWLGICWTHWARVEACLRCRRSFSASAHRFAGREPVEGWRWWSRLAREVAVAAASLREDNTRPVDWSGVESLLARDDMGAALTRVGFFRVKEIPNTVRLAKFLNSFWLEASGLTVRLEWAGYEPELRIGGAHLDGLFAMLSFELVALAAGAHHVFLCAGCGMLRFRERRAKANQRNYCRDLACQRRKQADAEAKHSAARRQATRFAP